MSITMSYLEFIMAKVYRNVSKLCACNGHKPLKEKNIMEENDVMIVHHIYTWR